MTYRRLDETENEIRVLYFPPDRSLTRGNGRISCTLQHVSLKPRPDESIVSDHMRSDQSFLRYDEFTRLIEFRDNRLVPKTGEKKWHGGSGPFYCQSKEHRYSWGDFEALSYTWGEEKPGVEIELDGKFVKIPTNLEAALRALYNLAETRKGMKYWVDYLCINQQDTCEKEHQVKRMRHIYSSARAVIVWLGQATPEDKDAFRAMQNICRTGEIPKESLPGQWNALCKFMAKQYWGRTWIIQELALNHNATLLLCGKRRFTRGMIRKGAHFCQKYLQEQNLLGTDEGEEKWATSRRVGQLLRLTYSPDRERNTEHHLNLVRKASVTDPRDKVFGILGLVDPEVSKKITPDYKRSVQQVYTDLTTLLIQNSGGLDQILLGGLVKQGWPSWVPDWRVPLKRHHVRKLGENKADGGIQGSYRFETENSHPILICQGYCIDVIDGVGAGRGQCTGITESKFNHNRYGELATEALSKTLTVSHPRTHEEISILNIPWEATQDASWEDVCATLDYGIFHEFREANKDLKFGGKPFRDFFPTLEPQKTKPEELMENLHLAIVSLVERVITTTETGYMCLTPANTLREDLVVILPGCNCPVLLRKSGANYSIIGECYVHGIMHGEAFEPGFEAEYSVHEFRLQ